MKLKPVGINTQISNILSEQSEDEKISVKLKIEFTKESIDSVIKINGNKVYHAKVIGNDIWYFLKKMKGVTDASRRKYYYPIQYAEIVFFNDLP